MCFVAITFVYILDQCNIIVLLILILFCFGKAFYCYFIFYMQPVIMPLIYCFTINWKFSVLKGLQKHSRMLDDVK